jgi:hypothetical protein
MVQIPQWVKDKQEKQEKEKEEYQKTNLPEGYKGYLKLVNGENKLTFDMTHTPTEGINKFNKPQTHYGVIQEGQKYILSVSALLDRLIISELTISGNTTMTIIKTGSGKETRYEIKK